MDDLISRGALLAAMGLETATKWGNKSAEQQHNSYSTWMCYEIADEINGAPPVDAVEVVRCGQCKKRGTKRCPMFEDSDETMHDWTEPDNYCFLGVRMDVQTDQRPETGEAKQDG